jgi:hypothetical protein
LSDLPLGSLSIGLRTPDYGDELGRMLRTLEVSLRAEPHFRG